MKSIRIIETGETALKPLTRLRSFSEIRSGIFTTIEFLRIKYPEAVLYYDHPDEQFLQAFLERNSFCKKYSGEKCDLEIHEQNFQPWHLINNISKNVSNDFDLYEKIDRDNSDIQIVGNPDQLKIHSTANIYPGVIFDVTEGPVIIEENVTITPFSFIKGPVFVAAGSSLDNCKIANSIVGKVCRLGGEIESSIIGDFTNKHHEGFLGHSVIGRWVNIGALATTSDLKNNYGEIKIEIAGEKINTGQIKLGSIIADYVKIAIGVMLNTGTVVDFGSNLFSTRVNGYIHLFNWGENRYDYVRFLQDVEKIMLRRGQKLSSSDKLLISTLY